MKTGTDTDLPAVLDPRLSPTRPGPSTRVLLGTIAGYQAARAGRPSGCRFTPSCSAYAREAIERRGLWRGVGLAVRRLLRCRPWGGFGYDPVPEGRLP